MVTLLSDSFTRADSATSPGVPDTGGPYTAASGTWGISSNALYTAVAGTDNVLTFPAAADLSMTATLTGTGSFGVYGGLVFRYVDINNYWVFVSNVGYYGWQLKRRVAGSFYTAQSGPVSSVGYTEPTTLKVEAYGSSIYCSVNGVNKAVLDDGTFRAATIAGFYTGGSSAVPRLDSATVTDLAAHPASLNGSSSIHTYKGRDLNTDDTGSAA